MSPTERTIRLLDGLHDEWDNPTTTSSALAFKRSGSVAAAHTIKVDDKGRLTIPQTLRKELGIEPGDTMFVEREPNGVVLRYAKAESPFDGLALHAEQEYRAGRTKNLRAFAHENHITIVDE